jgi:hypothetical protein
VRSSPRRAAATSTRCSRCSIPTSCSGSTGRRPRGGSRIIRGAEAVGGQARLFSGRARFARLALVDGTVGVVVAPRGHVTLALTNRVADGRITEFDVIADPEHLAALDITYLDI